MTKERLLELVERYGVVNWEGECFDCDVGVVVGIEVGGKGIKVQGGAVYEVGGCVYLKCDDCYGEEGVLKNYQDCMVFSRVVGYLQPVENWNPGKQSEYRDRKVYNMGGN